MDRLLRMYFKCRYRRLRQVHKQPLHYQHSILKSILRKNRNTEFGQRYAFHKIPEYDIFRSQVPVQTYESLFPFIEQMIDGDRNILCRDKTDWFARSSGTATGRSKYIPVTKSYLRKNHLKCAWDAATLIYNEDSRASLFRDKSLIMGGSLESIGRDKMTGDISAIIIKHFPSIGRQFYTPDFDTALMSDWQEKIERMARICSKQNVTLLAGVPTWTIVLFREILKITGSQHISEVWPNLRSYLHGGVHFEPYRDTFRQFLPSDDVIYREVYNASEGYFAIQDAHQRDGMLLLCNHDIFYEFAPLSQNAVKDTDAVDLSGVVKDQPYAMLITTGSGLYRYNTGDVVSFTDLKPYRIKVSGRTGQQINVFGEELSVRNASEALAQTCTAHKAAVREFTVAPVFMNHAQKGRHDWCIEFEVPPENMDLFAADLDRHLRQLNSDYDAKRSDDLAIGALHLHALSPGTCDAWYRRHDKYGGQNKMPRLRNDRQVADELLAMDKQRQHFPS